jgi:polysaccharide pyruvyl transferase WcaK-like protein
MSEGLIDAPGGEAPTGFRAGIMGASLFTGNRGVSALGASLARLIWQSRPDATISLLIGNRDAAPAGLSVDGTVRLVHTVNYRLSPRAPLSRQLWWIVMMSSLYRAVPSGAARKWVAQASPWLRYVAEADFVGDIRGGDSFSDIYGISGFLRGSLPVLSVIWIRGGLHLLPQTYGPFRSKLTRLFARYILLRAESIWCRDRPSLQEVARLTGGRRQGCLCPDVAFALEAVRPEPAAIDPPLPDKSASVLIGLNVNGLVYNGGYTRANMFGLKLDYRAFLTRLVEQLLSDQSSRVLLVPHTYAPEGHVESDPAACSDVRRQVAPSLRARVHLVTGEYDQHQIKGVIGLCDFFIGSRMHACIGALSQGIPTIGVAYSRKFVGVFDVVGAADSVIDGRTECVEGALIRVRELFSEREANKATLAQTVPAARTELARAFRQIAGAQTPSDKSRRDGS